MHAGWSGGEQRSGAHAPLELCRVLTVVAGPGCGRRVVLGPGRHVIAGSEPDGAGLAGSVAVHLDADGTAVLCRLDEVAVPDGGAADAGAGAGADARAGAGAGAGARTVPPADAALITAGRARLLLEEATGRSPGVAGPAPEVAASGAASGTAPPPRPRARPPQRPSEPPPDAVAVPAARPVGSDGPRAGAVALLAPAVLAMVVGALVSWRYALIGLASPVLMAIQRVEDRRRRVRARRAGHRDLQEELQRCRGALTHAATAETARRHRAHPPLGLVLRWPLEAPSPLWTGRCGADGLALAVGRGRRRWAVPLGVPPGGMAAPAADLVEAASWLDEIPVGPVLAPGAHLAVVAAPSVRSGVLRALLLRLTLELGPADLRLIVQTDADGAPDWEWAAPLPHLRHPDDAGLLVAPDPTSAAGLATGLATGPATGPAGGPALVVVAADRSGPPTPGGERPGGAVLVEGVDTPAFLAATTTDALVHDATTDTWSLVRFGAGPRPRADPLATLDSAEGMLVPDAVDEPVAAAVTALVGAWSDPLAAGSVARPPDVVSLRDLAGLPAAPVHCAGPGDGVDDVEGGSADESADASADVIAARWAAARAAGPGRLATAIGCTAAGPWTVDLAADGPHALVAGTTGSGKSELLRSLVLGLALAHPPSAVTFVLVDYKGGAAFGGLEALPHTVGLVTDLDAALARRALICLEAELRHREQVLAARGAVAITDPALVGAATDPALVGAATDTAPDTAPAAQPATLPRLVVVVDEFATMVKELPGFVRSLVDIAQRGRSLGVHLVLGTQRPGGVLDDDIRANTAVRIALRMTDAAHSVDVVGTPAAAQLPRTRPGRAIARLGPAEHHVVQIATATLPAAGAPDPRVTGIAAALATDRPSADRPSARQPTTDRPAAHDAGLDALVALCRTVAERTGEPTPRRPWPDPLPTRLGWGALGPGPDGRWPAALIDQPALQRVMPAAVDPADGSIAVIGATGSGTSAALRTIICAQMMSRSADELHVWLIDGGNQRLAPLARFPHAAGCTPVREGERLERAITALHDELVRRQGLGAAATAAEPAQILAIDGLANLRATLDDAHGRGLLERLHQILSDGPAVGIRAVITTDRVQGIPFSMLASLPRRLVGQVADTGDLTLLGLRADDTLRLGQGRVLDSATRALMQLAEVTDADLERLAAACPPPRRHPVARVEVLPDTVGLGDLPDPVPWSDPVSGSGRGSGRGCGGVLFLPVGLLDDLRPAELVLHAGDSVLVTGPARSGRSWALALIAVQAARAARPVHVVAGPRSGLLRALAGFGRDPDHHPDSIHDHHPDSIHVHEDLHQAWAHAAGAGPAGPQGAVPLLLVDDADLVPEAPAALTAALQRRDTGLCVVASGRADALRSAYGHWTGPIRRSRVGIALRPDVDLDGELWSTPLPRRRPRRLPPGRGYLVADGEAVLVQLAVPG